VGPVALNRRCQGLAPSRVGVPWALVPRQQAQGVVGSQGPGRGRSGPRVCRCAVDGGSHGAEGGRRAGAPQWPGGAQRAPSPDTLPAPAPPDPLWSVTLALQKDSTSLCFQGHSHCSTGPQSAVTPQHWTPVVSHTVPQKLQYTSSSSLPPHSPITGFPRSVPLQH